MSLAERLRLSLRRKLPVLLQTEAAECGVACLAMVASYHGHAVDVATLRRRFTVSMRGATLAALMQLAARLGLETRAVRVELEDLARLRLPCILHWSFTHFVVLRRVTRRGLLVHDPARGFRRVRRAEAGSSFTGVALELWPSPRFTPRAPAPAVRLRALVGNVRGLAGALAQILLLAATLETFVLANPLLMQWVVDHALVTASRDLLTLLALGFGLLVLFEQSTAALRGVVIMHFEATLNVQWQANVLAHLLRLPLPYFEKRHLGDIVSRFRSIDVIQRTVTTTFVEAIVDGAMSLLLLAVMLCYSAPLAAVCVAAIAVYAALRWVAHAPLRDARHEQIAAAAKQDSHFIETARGVRAIKLFARGDERRGAWLGLLVEQINAGARVQRLGLALRAGNGLTLGLENVLVVYLGASLVLSGALSTGMLLAFVAYQRQFAVRVSTLIDKLAEVRLLRLHCERLGDIVLTAPEQHDGSGRLLVSAATPGLAIRARGLRFRYGEHEPYVLDGVDLEIAPGECVALVGASGSGKSTLLSLLLGLLAPSAGEIAIAGVAPRELAGAQRTVAGVMQGDCLFAGSIADNISFFAADADQRRVEECARLAAIHSDIAKLPMAYNTLVGFMGSTLSAGQQQRILLARALYAQPAVLILDEATSHLDAPREAAIAAAVAQLGMTRIIAAHRRETLAAADRIVRLDAGRIVAEAPGPRRTVSLPAGESR
ncbi:MAG TPA: peptidase domain-containing ABC transporter [Gammaproteobacteria bacterium]|nr:peptidase domain-containing ABC transporter [Gammaproteobacteria bacterium]